MKKIVSLFRIEKLIKLQFLQFGSTIFYVVVKILMPMGERYLRTAMVKIVVVRAIGLATMAVEGIDGPICALAGLCCN